MIRVFDLDIAHIVGQLAMFDPGYRKHVGNELG